MSLDLFGIRWHNNGKEASIFLRRSGILRATAVCPQTSKLQLVFTLETGSTTNAKAATPCQTNVGFGWTSLASFGIPAFPRMGGRT